MCANPHCNNMPMYTMVNWPRNMALAEMVYLSRRCNTANLNDVPIVFSRNRIQGYNACIHDFWAMMKDTCYTTHHIM